GSGVGGVPRALCVVVVRVFGGMVRAGLFPADPAIYQVEHLRTTFHWDLIGKLFTDPVGLLETRYGWGTAGFDGPSFITNLSALIEMLGEPARLRPLPRRGGEAHRRPDGPHGDSPPPPPPHGGLVWGRPGG